MKRLGLLLLATLLAVAVLPAVAATGQPQNFVAPLSGDEEVPAVETRARGMTKFQLNSAGDELHFRLIAANIENVTMAHIHCGAAGENGPVVVWLYPEGPPPELIPGRFSGVLAVGTITDDDVIPEADRADCPGLTVDDFDDLLDLIDAGEAYVNVHTLANPPGEIRGQIR